MSLITLQQGSRAHKAGRVAVVALAVVAVVLTPYVFTVTRSVDIGRNTFTLALPTLTRGVCYTVAILGLTVVLGWTGQLALGNTFFMGTGAYVTGALVASYGWPWFATLLVVVPLCLLLGVIAGLPAVRLQGIYLALITLGLAALFPSVVRLRSLEEHTAGSNGLRIRDGMEAPEWMRLSAFSSDLSNLPLVGDRYFGPGELRGRAENEVYLFFLVVVMALACFWLVRNIRRSPVGRALIAVRDNPLSASINGVHVTRYKTLAFGLSAVLAGVAGSMYTMAFAFVAPDVFGMELALFLVVGLVVGGSGSFAGAGIGGLLIACVPIWTSEVTAVPGIDDRYLAGPTGTAFIGLAVIVVLFLLPKGITGGLAKLWPRIVSVDAPETRTSAIVPPLPRYEPTSTSDPTRTGA